MTATCLKWFNYFRLQINTVPAPSSTLSVITEWVTSGFDIADAAVVGPTWCAPRAALRKLIHRAGPPPGDFAIQHLLTAHAHFTHLPPRPRPGRSPTKWPAGPIGSNSAIVSGTLFGSGAYTASASSSVNTLPPYMAFDGVLSGVNFWNSAQNMYSSTGAYAGALRLACLWCWGGAG